MDEIHRYRDWRNYLKGLFDERGPALKILVTGSARLDLYRFKGDSLQGRYHLHHLFPLSVAELQITDSAKLDGLMELSGFPEPYFSQDQNYARRWSIEYRSRVINEEVTTIERIHDLAKVELLALRLPELVGSPLSINSLREDLETSHPTLSRWLEILERFYAIMRISPIGSPKIRAVKKEQKHYHFDWSLVKDIGARFENLVALHLSKWVHYERDTKGRELELRYFRDVDGREVDFIITENRQPIMAVECKLSEKKLSEKEVSDSLRYFKRKFPNVDAYQVHKGTATYRSKEDINITSATQFLSKLI